MDNQAIKEKVKDIFTRYLTINKHRKTPERFAILNYVYDMNTHFEMETLYQTIINDNFQISKATLYNTMNLLLDCGLVHKHQFGSNTANYERAYGNDNHDHIICTVCGQVLEQTNENLFTKTMQKKIKKFTIHHYSMYIYGICSKCSHARRMEMKRLSTKTDNKK